MSGTATNRAATAWRRLFDTTAPRAVLLVRLAVGIVFLSEGVQKVLLPDALGAGAGRFARIGIPAPEVMGPFVGVIETVCGALVLGGLLTRLAAVPLAIDMMVAIVSTKVAVLIGHGFWGFAAPSVLRHGLGSMLHEARTDLAMILGAFFLALAGGGAGSIDAWLSARRRLPGGGGASASVTSEARTSLRDRLLSRAFWV